MAVKDRIPDEAALIHAVDERLDEFTAEVRERVGALESEFRKHRLRLKIGYIGSVILFVLFVAGGELGFLNGLNDTTLLLGIVFMIAFPIVAVVWWALGVRVIKYFHTGVDAVLYEKAFQLFGVAGRLIPQPIPTDIWKHLKQFGTHTEMGRTLQFLDASQLITSPYNRTRIDDAWDIAVGDSNLYMCELNVQHESGSGKNRRVVTLFNGVFAVYGLDKKLEGKTIVTTDHDMTGLGSAFFWPRGKGAVRTTELEWNDFESLLRVSTNSEVEARTILTTDYMNDLYDWWKEQKGPIRISFIGDRMYLLFPNRKIRFDDTIEKINNEEVKSYLLTIAKPLMHVVHLIEDVRL